MRVVTTSLLLLLCGISFAAPRFRYFDELSAEAPKNVKPRGAMRIVEFGGRKGLNMTSIHSAVELPRHTLTQTRGSVTIWMLPLEELSPFPLTPNLTISNPYIRTYPFLSDNPNPQNLEEANFKFVWDAGWHPNLMVVFAKGGYLETFDLPHRAFATSSCFDFRSREWYQLTLTWDYERDQYQIFVNGVLVGKQNHFTDQRFHRDSISGPLYIGNPALVISEIEFYDHVLTADQIAGMFAAENTLPNEELQAGLRHTYAGENRKPFLWKPDETWRLNLDVPMTRTSDLDNFVMQGRAKKVEITPQGLLIETIDTLYNRQFLEEQMYLWSARPFEGDIYIEYEFNSLRPGGLSLLVTHASGMSREDFMADYPVRTSGRMGVIFKEDIRNYHWEIYREMADVRNDLASFAIIKNPFNAPISFGCLDRQLEKNTWHKVQLLKQGDRLTGAIDGVAVLDGMDNGYFNNGASYNFGRIAIRCMLHTKMLFRNMKVYNHSDLKTIKIMSD